jgi:hypothetical protein
MATRARPHAQTTFLGLPLSQLERFPEMTVAGASSPINFRVAGTNHFETDVKSGQQRPEQRYASRTPDVRNDSSITIALVQQELHRLV